MVDSEPVSRVCRISSASRASGKQARKPCSCCNRGTSKAPLWRLNKPATRFVSASSSPRGDRPQVATQLPRQRAALASSDPQGEAEHVVHVGVARVVRNAAGVVVIEERPP